MAEESSRDPKNADRRICEFQAMSDPVTFGLAFDMSGVLSRGGSQWQDSGLVFTTEVGGPVEPRNVLRTIEIAADKAGVENVGVHTLRHSAAVAWLEPGVHIKLTLCSSWEK
jgi:hypothetical protein